MKKTFQLTRGAHAPARVIDSIKAELHKHIKRERTKVLPEGVDFWDFECKIGPDTETASQVHVSAIARAVDDAASTSTTESIYVEIETKGKRRNPSKPKPKTEIAEQTNTSVAPEEDNAPPQLMAGPG